MDDRDDWLDGVRRWFYGGTEPADADDTVAPTAALPPVDKLAAPAPSGLAAARDTALR